jgi:putative ABC transport system substrate-binding protein
MRRRDLVALLVGAALGGPRDAGAQSTTKVHRIGVLTVGSTTEDMVGPDPENPYVRALLAGLRERGYSFGKQFVTEPRGGNAMAEHYPALVAEVVRAKPDVIVAAGPMLRWIKRETSTIPVVMTASDDPIGEGLVRSLAQPGGNFTGLSHLSVEIVGKRLQLLKELVPDSGPIAVFWDDESIGSWRAAESIAQQEGWPVVSIEIKHADEIEAAFRSATDARASSALVFAAGHLFGRAKQVVGLATRYRLPGMYQLRPYVEVGGLMSYSASLTDIWKRGAGFVVKILEGAKPADLPVEQPTRFELVINLKAAKAINLTVPDSLLAHADEVIE